MLTLAADEIHIWTWPVAEHDNASLDTSLLDEAELGRLASYRFSDDQQRFCQRHQALRRLLGRYTGQAPASLHFTTNRYGKPRLRASESGPRIHFSLSHSRTWNGVAIRRDAPLGLDVEDVDHRLDHLGLAERCFAPQEVAQLRSCPVQEQLATFFQLWTVKEAFIKACGLGLSLPLKSFTIQLAETIRLLTAPTDQAHQTWQFGQWSLAPASYLSVAVPQADRQVPLAFVVNTLDHH